MVLFLLLVYLKLVTAFFCLKRFQNSNFESMLINRLDGCSPTKELFWLNTTKPQLSFIKCFINKESTSSKFRHLLSLLLNKSVQSTKCGIVNASKRKRITWLPKIL